MLKDFIYSILRSVNKERLSSMERKEMEEYIASMEDEIPGS